MDATQKWDFIQSELKHWCEAGFSLSEAYAMVYWDLDAEWDDATK
jgi:hypothetical protein